MSIVLGVGIAVTTITTIYLGKKGWQALHKAVGITPGVLVYQDPNVPLFLSSMTWQQLSLDKKHLKTLSDEQLRQLQRIDEKVTICHNYQRSLKEKNITPIMNEEGFIVYKLVYTHLPEILASHYDLINASINSNFQQAVKNNQIEAGQILQDALNNIEQRLDTLLLQIDAQNLQNLQIMKRYLDSRN